MTNQTIPKTAKQILATATPEQVRWVFRRILNKTDMQAAKEAGVHYSTVSKWPNKADLDIAVNLLLQDPIDAAIAMLREAVPEAAEVLITEVRMKGRHKMLAAEQVLDRMGVSAVHKVDLTSGGVSVADFMRRALVDKGNGSAGSPSIPG